MRIFLLSVFITCFSLSVEAQKRDWIVETRCVRPEISTQNEWDYPGTLVLMNYDGLYALNSQRKVPQQIVQNPGRTSGDEWITGTISPDSRWYAVIVGEQIALDDYRGVQNNVEAIRVYDTAVPDNFYTVNWFSKYTIYQGSGNTDQFYSQRLLWYDNQHIVYVSRGDGGVDSHYDRQIVLLNPFTSDVQPLQVASRYSEPALVTQVASVSPDFTRVAYVLFSGGHGLFDLVLGKEIATVRDDEATRYASVVWSPDSSQFLEWTRTEDQSVAVFLTDRDGRRIEVVNKLTSSGFYFSYPLENLWSSNGRYFSGVIEHPRDRSRLTSYTVHYSVVGDTVTRRLYNTCIQAGWFSRAWSPDNRMLAFSKGTTSGQRAIFILDLETWTIRHIADFEGYIIGWRSDN